MAATETGAGEVLAHLREHGPTTRRGLVDGLGWARMTVGKRLDELLAAGFVVSRGLGASEGGRPAETFAVDDDLGLLVGIDVGGSYTRVGITDMAGGFLAEDGADIGLPTGPGGVAAWVDARITALLAGIGRSPADVRAVGVGVPGPVDLRSGVIGAPLRESAWEGVRFTDLLTVRGDVQVVDRDVNTMAVAEHAALGAGDHTVVLRVGMGISCAFVLDGRVYRGERGGVGVLTLPGPDGRLRRLEDVASGYVVRERLASHGVAATTSFDLVSLVEDGHPLACQLVGEVGEALGRSLAEVVRLLNPTTVVVGGALSGAGGVLMAPLRRALDEGAGEYALQTLSLRTTLLGGRSGLAGAVRLAADAYFEPARISRLVSS
ncbi:ROK family transcriptional regulator [Arsenicicoccus cauae]|nr:ROK family protein [Arsenicicoccus cauae]